ncbi:MAG: class I SAM-dependent methyltransferase [Phycisphaerales bacterium]|nr:class I SAM-dependent methyltransferase [Phycisphaerales bacterium]
MGDHVAAIYGRAYAETYESLYVHQWPEKHAVNLFVITRLLHEQGSQAKSWLDVGCGQAWHFSKVTTPTVEKVGVDLSLAQLSMARSRNPTASLVCANMMDPIFSGAFSLVTSFWSPYAYLRDSAEVTEFLRRLAGWTQVDGSLYLDLMLPDEVGTFLGSDFARKTGFQLFQLAPDRTRWTYRDLGGDHEIVTPPLALFHDEFSRHFRTVDVEFDRGRFAHLIARGKRGQPLAHQRAR